MSHRIDLILPNGRVYFLPLEKNINGQDIIDFCQSFSLENYVICRNANKDNMYDILYSTNQEKIKENVQLKAPFVELQLSDIFISDRIITSRMQRMPLFVFEIDSFLQLYAAQEAQIKLEKFTKKASKITIKVQLQTKLVIDVSFKDSKSVNSISKEIYESFAGLYGKERIRSIKAYRFGTFGGFYPSSKAKFSETPELVQAYKQQLLNPSQPQFIFMQTSNEGDFGKASQQYIKDLELTPIIRTPEILCLNSAYSLIRRQVEAERISRLESDPLLARMRINPADPPLTTCKRKKIPIKAELRGVEITETATGISIGLDFDTTASQAIIELFDKMKTYQGVSDEFKPDDFVLVLQGTDEVVAGNTPFSHFVCVRQFLLSVTPFMNFLLYKKSALIQEIMKKELASKPLPEMDPEQLYQSLSFKMPVTPSFNVMPAFPHSLAKESFSIFIGACFKIPETCRAVRFAIKAVILHGTKEISSPVMTRPACGTTSVSFNETLNFSIQIHQIPAAARVALTLIDFDRQQKASGMLATINTSIFTFDGWFNSGPQYRCMWPNKDTDPLLTTCQCEDEGALGLTFAIPEYYFPMSYIPAKSGMGRCSSVSMRISQQQKEVISKLSQCKFDPLLPLSSEDRQNLYKFRNELVETPALLPYVLQSIDYSMPSQVSEIPALLKRWKEPSPTEALTLLDAQFADPRIRAYAVKRLEVMSDDELMLYLLQIIQALKYEVNDDSPLSRFLFRRGLAEPKFLGHQLFWQLISEAHLSHIRRRFSSFVVNFLYGIGSYRDELLKGYKFTQELVRLNQRLCKLSHSDATEPFREALRKIDLPNEFHLPMDPRLIVESFIVEKCKVMNSKKKPFWLTFKNAAPFATEPIRTLFKVGDDLRQDQLTLQVMKVMEHLWRKEGVDLHMRCYGVLPTGFNQGFIEVVPNAITEQALQQQKGTVKGIWDNTTLLEYINKANQTESAQLAARQNFMYSSAGYAVATCVLGIADRHPGNIMMQSDGHFLHIDFGHFLGNFKTKLGYQRENAPYHFSPACACVLGDVDSDMFKEYRRLCGQALNILRHNSRLLVTLLMLMLGTGIPELQKPEDIRYMTNMLFLDKTDEQAVAEFDKLTNFSLESTRTKLNNLFHNIAVSD